MTDEVLPPWEVGVQWEKQKGNQKKLFRNNAWMLVGASLGCWNEWFRQFTQTSVTPIAKLTYSSGIPGENQRMGVKIGQE